MRKLLTAAAAISAALFMAPAAGAQGMHGGMHGFGMHRGMGGFHGGFHGGFRGGFGPGFHHGFRNFGPGFRRGFRGRTFVEFFPGWGWGWAPYYDYAEPVCPSWWWDGWGWRCAW
jgi:hypothetical protein